MNIHKNQIAIITKDAIDKNFKNEDSYLQRTISMVTDNELNEIATYRVRTDFVNYRTFEESIEDGTEEITMQDMDEHGNDIEVTITEPKFVTKTVNKLVATGVKQEWYKIQLTYNEINYMANMISIPENLSFKEREFHVMKVMLLMETQKEQPWGITAEHWKIRTEADLEIPLDEESV